MPEATPDQVRKLIQGGSPSDRLQALADENDDLKDKLWRVRQWCEAYPADVFLPVDTAKANAALKAAGIDVGALHAQWARHLLAGVGEIVGAEPPADRDADAGLADAAPGEALAEFAYDMDERTITRGAAILAAVFGGDHFPCVDADEADRVTAEHDAWARELVAGANAARGLLAALKLAERFVDATRSDDAVRRRGDGTCEPASREETVRLIRAVIAGFEERPARTPSVPAPSAPGKV